MKIKHCPDCTSGWRYADDLPVGHSHVHAHGLVSCPTCHGEGRVIEHDEQSVSASGRESAFANVALVFSMSRAQA
jgi:hypothetical protein